jgi:hypothetical protein
MKSPFWGAISQKAQACSLVDREFKSFEKLALFKIMPAKLTISPSAILSPAVSERRSVRCTNQSLSLARETDSTRRERLVLSPGQNKLNTGAVAWIWPGALL